MMPDDGGALIDCVRGQGDAMSAAEMSMSRSEKCLRKVAEESGMCKAGPRTLVDLRALSDEDILLPEVNASCVCQGSLLIVLRVDSTASTWPNW
jgi:hypothetical protein